MPRECKHLFREMSVEENGEGGSGGWGSFRSYGGLTPRRGKREGGVERWKEGGLMHLKMQDNSKELLTRTSVSPWAKVVHQRGPAPRNEPAHSQLLAGSSPWEVWPKCSLWRFQEPLVSMLSSADILNSTSTWPPPSLLGLITFSCFLPHKCESSRLFNDQNSKGWARSLLC